MNQDIVRTDNVLEAGHHFLAGREQHDFYLCRLFGVGKQECIFEAFGCFLGFIGGQPLLKQRRKGSLVDTLSGGEISDDNLPVAFERKFGQMMFTTCPGGKLRQLVQIDRLLLIVSGEDIIYPQRLILKIICKVLRITSCRNQEKKKNTANLFHINSIFMFFTKVQTIVDLFDICK